MSINYKHQDGIAIIEFDDGKANALSIEAFTLINQALDKAANDKAVAIITGKQGIFSAGFDLNELVKSPESSVALLRAGAALCVRLLSFPFPVIAACSGHAYPMGAFILMCVDYRIGIKGPYSLGMNEVRINLTVPQFAIEVARGRLNPAHFNRTAITGELFDPETAIAAGILDELVDSSSLIERACSKAEELKQINFSHHHATKLRVRSSLIHTITAAAEEELTIENSRIILGQV